MAAPRAARVLGRISADITGDASGNRGRSTFTQGQNRLGGPEDLENLAAWLGSVGLLSVPADRVTGL